MPRITAYATRRKYAYRVLFIMTAMLGGMSVISKINTSGPSDSSNTGQIIKAEEQQSLIRLPDAPYQKGKIDASKVNSACPVNCVPEFPCQYQEEANLRIIVITMDRADSLTKCLNSVSALNTLGDIVHVNIWVDRFKNGSVDSKTLKVSEEFADRWQYKLKKGSACVTLQPRNAYIHLQWVHTWRPQNNSKEIGLILEDDVDVSPFSYKWLKLAHERYDNDFRVTGYAIQGQNLISFGRKNGKRQTLRGRTNDTTFYWPFMKTWGFSPNGQNWRYFQEWYARNRWDPKVKPYVNNSITTNWYKSFEKKGIQASHWEQWHHYYSSLHNFYCVYNNFAHYAGKWLASNRIEKGLHFSGTKSHNYDSNLMSTWRKKYEEFSPNPVHLDIYGDVSKL